jgi:Rubisco LSMT substrate-binding
VEDFAAAGGGRGLIALQSIDQGGVVVKVPLTATLRVTGGWDENDGWAGVLAHMLLTQKELGVAATHGPYIQLGLPSEAPMTPCRWTEAELLQLQNTTFISEVQQNKIWRREQQHVHRSHGEANDDDAYLTMLDLVCSRTLKGRDNSRQLVPLIDIANHAPSESGGGSFKVDHNSVYLLAGHGGIKAGQAVTLDYGARTVEDFLLHYGFVPDRCGSDSVRIGQHCITWMDCAYRGHSDPRVRDACKEILNGFPTSMKEDLDLLNSMEKEAEAFRLALHYRFAKKSLLAAAAGIPVYG